MTDNERDFIRTICENPRDDSPRLVYADWLEEYRCKTNGDDVARRVEFIRDERPWANRKHLSILRKTLEPFPKSYKVSINPWPVDHGRFAVTGVPDLRWVVAYVRHGFIEQIWINQGAFGTICQNLFENHPVLDVFLTRQDPEASRPYAQFGWLRVGETVGSWPMNGVASPIWDRIAGRRLWESPGRHHVAFDSRADAYIALSAACVRWGRELAGLPPLASGYAEPAVDSKVDSNVPDAALH